MEWKFQVSLQLFEKVYVGFLLRVQLGRHHAPPHIVMVTSNTSVARMLIPVENGIISGVFFHFVVSYPLSVSIHPGQLRRMNIPQKTCFMVVAA